MRTLVLSFFLLLTLSLRAEDWREKKGIPRGVFPTLEVEKANTNPEAFSSNIEEFRSSMESTVRSIVSKRNMNCIGDPCLIQAVPLAFSIRGAGFWGGFRAKLINVRRQQPFLWSADLFALRSDQREWITRGSIDFPKVEFLPFMPRFKIRGNYSRSRLARYFGIGGGSRDNENLSFEQLRYEILAYGFQINTEVPLFRFSFGQLSSFLAYEIKKQTARPFDTLRNDGVLFRDRPTGFDSPHSSTVGGGFRLSSLNRDLLPTSGSETSLSGSISVPRYASRYLFGRATFIDKRYPKIAHRLYLAHRLTLDRVMGNAPYWELSAVGGPDPIRNIASSDLLRAYPSGRYHEPIKAISSSELRWHLNRIRVFNQSCEPGIVPLGIDFGYFHDQFALSAFAGSHLLCNESFLMQAFAGFSTMGFGMELEFGQNF